jgi:hypothetical protein
MPRKLTCTPLEATAAVTRLVDRFFQAVASDQPGLRIKIGPHAIYPGLTTVTLMSADVRLDVTWWTGEFVTPHYNVVVQERARRGSGWSRNPVARGQQDDGMLRELYQGARHLNAERRRGADIDRANHAAKRIDGLAETLKFQ